MIIKVCVLALLLLLVAGCKEETKEVKITETTLPKVAEAKPKPKPKPKAEAKKITTLEEALKAGVPVVVKLGSDSCHPCRQMNPIIDELAVEQEGKAIFLSLDVYENRALARDAQVRVIPTILFYDKHGQPKAKSEGGMGKADLLKAITELELNK
ncbi:MAG: thioredoxin family protein [bacterium]